MKTRSLLAAGLLATSACGRDDPFGLNSPSEIKVESLKFRQVLSVGSIDTVRVFTDNFATLEGRIAPKDWTERPPYSPLQSTGRGHIYIFSAQPNGARPGTFMAPGDTVTNYLEIRGKDGRGMPVTIRGRDGEILRMEVKIYLPK